MSEVSTGSQLRVRTVKETWVDLLLTRGPISVIAIGGTGALYEGIFPFFNLQKAIFGSTLLLLAAAFDLFIWMVRRRDVAAELEALSKARSAVESKREEIDRSGPWTRDQEKSEQPRLPS